MLSVIIGSLYLGILLVLTITDATKRIIPNRIIYPALFLVPIFAFVREDFGVIDSVLGMATGFGIMFIFWRMSRQTIGAGDVKLAALIGGMLGMPAIFLLFLLAAVLSFWFLIVLSILKHKQLSLPYGPFLTTGAMVIIVSNLSW